MVVARRPVFLVLSTIVLRMRTADGSLAALQSNRRSDLPGFGSTQQRVFAIIFDHQFIEGRAGVIHLLKLEFQNHSFVGKTAVVSMMAIQCGWRRSAPTIARRIEPLTPL